MAKFCSFRSEYEYEQEHDIEYGTTLEFQTSGVSGAIPPSCCLPVEKKAPGMRLVNYVT